MPSIKIREQDNTTVMVQNQSSDAVFIPGFVTSNVNYLTSLTAPKAFVPTYVKTLDDFKELFGAVAPVFADDQLYHKYTTEEPWGFAPAVDCPNTVDPVMITAGTYDYGYSMAYTLLAKGLPVVYCRVNGDIGNIEAKFTDMSDANGWANTQNSEQKYVNIGKICSVTVAEKVTLYRVVQLTSTPSLEITSNIKEPSIEDMYQALSGIFVETERDTTTETKTGDGQTKEFALEHTPIVEGGAPIIAITVGNVRKIYTTDFTVSGNTVSFNIAPDDGASIVIQYSFAVSITRVKKDSVFDLVSGVGDYDIKYLTSGGYPSFGYIDGETASGDGNEGYLVVANMLGVASDTSGRGDCLALIDHTNYLDRPVNPLNSNSIFYRLNEDNSSLGGEDGQFGAMFTPWCEYSVMRGVNALMPGSFGYLCALAESIQSNGNWLAIAGVNRGRPTNLIAPYETTNIITNKIADEYNELNGEKGICLNAITYIRPYGYVIWGNRTLKENIDTLTATSYVNIRNMISDIRKVAFQASRSLMFEQNNEILWINFKAKMTPLLDKLVSGYGIKKYNLVRQPSDAKNKLVCSIIIYPTYAVEAFDITIVLEDDET